MIHFQAPSYRFTFSHGLSRTGTLQRESLAMDGDNWVTHHFRYHLDDGALSITIGQPMPPEVSDLIDVSAAIFLADRLAPRAIKSDIRQVNERWRRRMEVFIPVRCLDRWLESDVHALIENLAMSLSDDSWTFHFVPRLADPRPGESQRQLLPSKQRTTSLVALHSGGLDSLCGLVQAATTERISNVLAVSVVSNWRLIHATKDVVDALRSAVSTDIESLRLWIHVKQAQDNRESSQRTRSLLFLAAGVAVASLAGTTHFQLTENGPGAINLPCSSDQIGARMSRAVHPKTLSLFTELATRVIGQPFVVMNTGLFHTKAELAQVLHSGDYAPAVRATVSCDRFPYWKADTACGTCSSCLYRRIALHVVQLAHLDEDRYRERDLLARNAQWKGLDLVPLDSQRNLVELLRGFLAMPEPIAALRAEFVAIDDVMEVAPHIGMAGIDIANAMTRLFESFVADNDAFFARIDRPGWPVNGVPMALPSPLPTLVNVG